MKKIKEALKRSKSQIMNVMSVLVEESLSVNLQINQLITGLSTNQLAY